jgi:hypothetical protein
MLVRPDRLLPSVIVGALLTGALALGAGTASADSATCTVDGERFTLIPGVLTAGPAEECRDVLGLPATLAAVRKLVSDAVPDAVPDPAPTTTTTTTAPPTTTTAAPRDDAQRNGRQQADQAEAQHRAQQEAAQRAAAEAAQRAAQQQAAGGAALVAPAAGAPGGLAATVPLLNFGTPNPALLLAPPGSPLRTLAGENTGSPVTTTSDVQAMAFDNMPGGMGTPAVVGVLILSTLGAFALRHRVLRRAGTSSTSSD